MGLFEKLNFFKKSVDTLETVSAKDVPIFKAGFWNGAPVTLDDLQAMVDAFSEVGFQPTIKAGHEKKQEDPKESERVFGYPSLGYVEAIRVKGDTLYADLTQIPKRFAALINAGAFKRISAEVYHSFVSNDKTFPRVLKAIAFLGNAIPAIPDLEAIEALYDAEKREFHVYELEADFCDGMYMLPKKAKSKVNYGIANGNSTKNCGTCRYAQMYNNGCGLVEGTIERGHTCDMYEGPLDYSEKTESAPPEKTVEEADETKEEFSEKTTQNPGGETMDKDLELAAAKEALEKVQKDYSDAQAALKKQESDLAAVKEVADKAAVANTALSEQMKNYEKELTEQKEARRLDAIKTKVADLKKAGKVAPKWENQLVAIFSYLPDNAVHTYSDDEGKEQKVAIVDALYSIFEQNASLFSEKSKQDPEETSDDPREKFTGLVKAYQEKHTVAYGVAVKAVTKVNPELAQEYNKAISKSN
jgi:DNA-binding transcriptional regulator GbsR (MarR family)